MDSKQVFDLEELFEDVQLNAILDDGKTFVDCIPRSDPGLIEEEYQRQKLSPGFNLKNFILDNFDLPREYASSYQSKPQHTVEENIAALWELLTRSPGNEVGSLINLPFQYIVPGGRFREIYYWDSYFTMLGLKVHNGVDLVESMVKNFAHLINTYGHIPNGNRSYYLGRSQPPFFALMVTLLSEAKKDNAVYATYCDALVREYDFWQRGAAVTSCNIGRYRVVRMPGGEILNRYFDNHPGPRQESYREDVQLAEASGRTPEVIYTHLRAGAESGWDFSSRWFKDGLHLETIQTTEIVPVDLNCLLYCLENTISRAMHITGDKDGAKEFSEKALDRKIAILQYCWNEEQGFFCDYDFNKLQQRAQVTAAGLYPLFVGIATQDQADRVAQQTAALLLKKGGVVTSTVHSGQQWDAPNGWAPLQWIAFVGLKNYQHTAMAADLAGRWLSLVEKVFDNTGKLMEKYNVENLDLPAGGGEYAGQDGFGWTNGVYLALKEAIRDKG